MAVDLFALPPSAVKGRELQDCIEDVLRDKLHLPYRHDA
jgi:hypothetical protein